MLVVVYEKHITEVRSGTKQEAEERRQVEMCWCCFYCYVVAVLFAFLFLFCTPPLYYRVIVPKAIESSKRGRVQQIRSGVARTYTNKHTHTYSEVRLQKRKVVDKSVNVCLLACLFVVFLI